MMVHDLTLRLHMPPKVPAHAHALTAEHAKQIKGSTLNKYKRRPTSGRSNIAYLQLNGLSRIENGIWVLLGVCCSCSVHRISRIRHHGSVQP